MRHFSPDGPSVRSSYHHDRTSGAHKAIYHIYRTCLPVAREVGSNRARYLQSPLIPTSTQRGFTPLFSPPPSHPPLPFLSLPFRFEHPRTYTRRGDTALHRDAAAAAPPFLAREREHPEDFVIQIFLRNTIDRRRRRQIVENYMRAGSAKRLHHRLE